tara:strand:- start:284 stop:1072 length:789 start_codon:yes stop_codon:yes gene_type:complete
MKIFDCTIYFDEDLMLDLRMNILDQHVEKFIIVEAAHDHQGNIKKRNFDIKNFKKFENKIQYFFIESIPQEYSSWERENYQRNYIGRCLGDLHDDDLVIISDVDEIPNLKSINKFYGNRYSVFEQKMFYYKFNLLNNSKPFWYGSKLCKKKYLKSPQWLRNLKSKQYPFWRFDKTNINIIKNGGWHFSFIRKPDEIIKKIESYAHVEFNRSQFKDKKEIIKKINMGEDIFGRGIKYSKIDIDDSFPEYIQQNKDKFSEWIAD